METSKAEREQKHRAVTDERQVLWSLRLLTSLGTSNRPLSKGIRTLTPAASGQALGSAYVYLDFRLDSVSREVSATV